MGIHGDARSKPNRLVSTTDSRSRLLPDPMNEWQLKPAAARKRPVRNSPIAEMRTVCIR
jgi:hypothetical protein